MSVRRPVLRKLAKTRLLGQLARFTLFILIFRLDGFDQRSRVDSSSFSINLPQLLMILDALVKEWLGNRRVIHFAVAMASVADQIDNHVAAKRGAIVGRDSSDADNRVGIFSVHVKNGHGLPLRDVRGESRRMF